ncbi:LHFPL tetraspan subfamily member 6 protein-like [Glandiceps talaboti]
MAGSLTKQGIVWAIISLIGTSVACAGYYLPYWIQGSYKNHTVHLGIFRRCNYYKDDVMILECGRYTTFSDIPTLSWQICTIVIGVGCGLAILISLTALLSCCISDLITRKVGRIAGGLQFLAGALIATGCVLYPNGWNHIEVQQVCDNQAESYNLGSCKIVWAYFMCSIGAILIVIASFLTFKAGKGKMGSYAV